MPSLITLDPSQSVVPSSSFELLVRAHYDFNRIFVLEPLSSLPDVHYSSSLVFSSKNSCIYDYGVIIPANTGPERNFTVAFRASGALYEESLLEVTQSSGELEPVIKPEGSVHIISQNPVSVASGDSSVQATVLYSESVGYHIDTPGGTSNVYITMSNSSSEGNNTTVNYQVNFPANATTDSIQRHAFFQMTSGSSIPTANLTINQAGKEQVVGKITVYEVDPYSAFWYKSQSYMKVYYDSASSGNYTILNPVTQSGTSIVQTSNTVVGERTIREYLFNYPVNNTGEEIHHEVQFRMSSSLGLITKDQWVYHQASPEPQYAISTSWTSITTDAEPFTATCIVKYTGGTNPSDFVGTPLFDGNITEINAEASSSGDNSVTITYGITGSANTNLNSVASGITWNIPSGPLSQISIITQLGAEPEPELPSIEVGGSPITIQSGDQRVNFTVTYRNCVGWNIGVAGTNKSDMHVTSGSAVTSGNDKIVEYEVTFPGNALDEPVERRVFFQLEKSGEDPIPASGIITQLGKVTPGNISVRPPEAYVASWDSQSVFYGTYTFNNIDYTIKPLTGSTGVSVETLGGSIEDGVGNYTYRASFPTNSASTPVTRSVTLRMESGSWVAIKSYFIYQDAAAAPTAKSISINPSYRNLGSNEVSTTCTATYLGFSSLDEIGTPSTSATGWYASVGSVQQSSGQITINWIFTGPANTNSTQKVISFYINAPGVSSKTFTIYQAGAGGGGGVVTASVYPVWQDHHINSSLGEDTLVVNSGSTVIFQDKVFARPGESIDVNLTKIYEPYVSTDPIVLDETNPGQGLTGLPKYKIPEFTASLQTGGQVHHDLVLRDWSYDNYWYSVGYGWLVENDMVDPYLYYKLVPGQFLVVTAFNTTAATHSATFYRPGGQSTGFAVPPKTYTDFIWRVQDCGEYRTGGEALFALNAKQWKVASRAKWVVYFRNRKNGLESLPIEGTVVPQVDVERNNYLQGVVNYTRTYLSKVIDKWTCRTGIVDDKTSEFLVNVMIQSPEVLLHDIKNDKVYTTRPITTSIEKKTFWNQGRQFATYEFELENIQTKSRR